MTPEQACRITQYPDVPRNRTEQEKLIATLYPRIQGIRLGKMGDRQIYSIARDMYARAQKEWRAFIEEQSREIAELDYHEFLYEIFNVPESQRRDTNPSDLERELLD